MHRNAYTVKSGVGYIDDPELPRRDTRLSDLYKARHARDPPQRPAPG